MRVEDLVSVDRRRRRWRPKPIALVILAIVGLLLVSAMMWGVSHIARAVAVRPMASPSSPSAEDDVTTVLAEEPYPITWTVRLGRDANGQIVGVVADPAVHEAVRKGFLEAWEWAFQSETPHNRADVERYFVPLPEGVDDQIFQPAQGYWYGLERALEDLDREAKDGILSHASLEGGAWVVEITRFSTDGARAVVRARYEGGTCALWFTDINSGKRIPVSAGDGEPRQESEAPCIIYVAGMVYDTTDGRWKVATLRLFRPEK